jgi:uncharacterized protein YjbK
MDTVKAGKEVELKLRLATRPDPERLRSASQGDSPTTVTQRNTFFDTPSMALNKRKYVVRVREEAGRFFVTAKGPEVITESTSIASRVEEEIEVQPAVAEDIDAGMRNPLEPLEHGGPSQQELARTIDGIADHQPLVRVGSFVNERTRIVSRSQIDGREVRLCLELDQTTFPGAVTHHELEVEIPEGIDRQSVRKEVDRVLREADARVDPGPLESKAKRFFAALRGETI